MPMACLLVHVWVKSKQPPTCTSSVIDSAFLSWAFQIQIQLTQGLVRILIIFR